MLHIPVSSKGKELFKEPGLCAEELIAYLQDTQSITETQQILLAVAHSAIACKARTSFNRSKMHANSAIAILKKMKVRDANWCSLMAHAYSLRAKLLEEEQNFNGAVIDFLLVIETLGDLSLEEAEHAKDIHVLAVAYAAIGNLLILGYICQNNLKLSHPLFYVNKGLETLSKLKNSTRESLLIQVCVQRIAGIVLGNVDFQEANQAFKVALHFVYQINSNENYPLLVEIYQCLGQLYEKQYQNELIHLRESSALETATLYFNISELFKFVDIPNEEAEINEVEQLFDVIYRLLDPYAFSSSKYVLIDIIDALIYIATSTITKTFPNKNLLEQLCQPSLLASFKQHLVWLLEEAYIRIHLGARLFTITDPQLIDIIPDISNIIAVLENGNTNNIHSIRGQE